QDNDILKEMMTDTFFLDLKNSYSIHLAGDFAGITSDALHTLYKNMMERSIKLRKFSNFDLLKEKCISFLKLIGITYRNGEFFSNRDIEACFTLSSCNLLTYLLKDMMASSTKLRSLAIDASLQNRCIPFLKMIGITFENEKLVSNRNIEV
ncbi:hypothetical protein PENTCL1PPCAC_25337, partial [Pristionchus entomophagus]